MDKNSELVHKVKDWVDEEYAAGRVTVLTDDELVSVILKNCEKLIIKLEKGYMGKADGIPNKVGLIKWGQK